MTTNNSKDQVQDTLMKLVNFNKIDKLDFDTLQVWSQVMIF